MLNALRKLFPVNGRANLFQPDLAEHTPDLWKLEQFERQLLFVVGDPVERNLAAEASFVGLPVFPQCYTRQPVTLWKKDLGPENSYPVILPENYRPTGFLRNPVEPAPVQGELWSIRPSQFILLDRHKQNGVQFKRERVDICLPYYEVGYSKDRPLPKISSDYFVTKPAWTYVGIAEYWDAQIGGIFASAQMDTMDAPIPRRRNNKFYRFDSEDC